MTTPSSPSDSFSEDRADPRPFASTQMPVEGRLFHSDEPKPCEQDPDLFFDSPSRHRAAALCRTCPFFARCSYNAVATGATHGIWGGIILPGAYPKQLEPVYAQLREQFNRGRSQELGDAPVRPLPELAPRRRRAKSAA